MLSRGAGEVRGSCAPATVSGAAVARVINKRLASPPGGALEIGRSRNGGQKRGNWRKGLALGQTQPYLGTRRQLTQSEVKFAFPRGTTTCCAMQVGA